MPGFLASCCEVFTEYLPTPAHKTVAMVRIDDPLLGFMHLVFKLIIFIYIVVIKIWMQHGYTMDEVPIGSIRLSLQPPVAHTCINHKGSDQQCDPDSPNYAFDFSPERPPYCADPDRITNPATMRDIAKQCGQVGQPCPCRYLDAIDVSRGPLPAAGGSPFYITTRATEAYHVRNPHCDVTQTPTACNRTFMVDVNHNVTNSKTNKPFTLEECRTACHHNDDNGGWPYLDGCPHCFNQHKFYVADIERYTLLLDHSVEAASRPQLSADATEMVSEGVYCNGKPMDIKLAKTSENVEIISIRQLLSAVEVSDDEDAECGIKLDEPSDTSDGKADGKKDGKSRRYDGMIILLNIEYSNTQNWVAPLDEIKYRYSVEMSRGAKSKVYLTEHYDHNHRVVTDAHGLKIVVRQTGSLSWVDTHVLLVNLTTSLGMLKLATLIVDTVMSHVLPAKDTYRGAKVKQVSVRRDPMGTVTASAGAVARKAKEKGLGLGLLQERYGTSAGKSSIYDEDDASSG